ncbi:Rieske 2Fe-2S domain-containing protein, partial [Vibrio cholerae]|uniref:Rieske 2Fe-2S domain-containing protein n=1 Tax=Vibrio cholerae TaxID=666 RepID=UPI001C4093BD
VRSRVPIRHLPEAPLDRIRPTWRDARPARIARALRVAQGRDAGGWHVVGDARRLGATESATRTVLGREVVLWRDGDELLAGPGACPHLGALLDRCP